MTQHGHSSNHTAKLDRRAILTGLATGVPAMALAQSSAQSSAQDSAHLPQTAAAAAQATPKPACQFLNAVEQRALTALLDRIIPADELGPGAVEADVLIFIDRQLAGAWGAGAHFYRTGPFPPALPQQGYQLAFTPAELFREGLARLDTATGAAHGKPFADLPPADQEALMHDMQQGKLDLGPVPSGAFLQAVLDATTEGFFSDPLYGGNKDMAGWKLVGFPGSYASYAQEIERHGLDWKLPPLPMSADQDLSAMLDDPAAICTTR